jgi:hypothetical protein
MSVFDFSAPAELFACRGMRPGRHPVRYRRFATGAEAVRYAMEELAGSMLAGTVIESAEMRFGGAQIRALYDSPAYPLPRTQSER